MLTLAQAIPPDSLAKAAPILFFVIAGMTVLSAWAIVLSGNIVRMSVYLLLTLGGAAGMYFMLEAEFLAAIQLIVYAGGTLILIIFGVMLTSKNPFMTLHARPWEKFVGILLGLTLASLLTYAVVTSNLMIDETVTEPAHYSALDIGRAMLTKYLVPFEVAAVLLLVVMIGAAYMARRRVGTEGQQSTDANNG